MKRDFGWIICAYVSALIIGASAAWFLAGTTNGSTLTLALVADVAATVVIFGFGTYFRNSSFYDAYWSVAPVCLFVYWALGTNVDLRGLLVGLLVLAWSIRLTHNWARGWQGLDHQDWRYVDLKVKTGRLYPLVDLFGIQMLPTLLVFAGCYPIWVVLAGDARPWSGLDLAWMMLGGGAVYLEYRADNVLRAFRLNPANAGQVLDKDVWSYVRHPNYTGELGFWLALGIAGFAASGNPDVFVGFTAILMLFVFISIPMIERRELANKPGYAAYRERCGALIPRIAGGPRES